jgi:hypothetical protein
MWKTIYEEHEKDPFLLLKGFIKEQSQKLVIVVNSHV